MTRNGPGRRALSEAQVAALVAEAKAAPRGGRTVVAQRYGVSPATVTRLCLRGGYAAPQGQELERLIARIRYVAQRGGKVSFRKAPCATLLAALNRGVNP